MSKTLELAIDLLQRKSNTPLDAGCQELMISRLEPLGFKIERMRFGTLITFMHAAAQQPRYWYLPVIPM